MIIYILLLPGKLAVVSRHVFAVHSLKEVWCPTRLESVIVVSLITKLCLKWLLSLLKHGLLNFQEVKGHVHIY